MRVLYVTYATWKSVVQTNGFAIYEKSLNEGTSYAVWAGATDIVYRSDVSASDLTDYTTTFPSGRVSVPDEDEALALIINLASVINPRSADGTQLFATQRLQLGQAAFLRTDNGSQVMNLDGRSSGSITVVWNGTGGSDTGGDWSVTGSGSQTSGADAGTGTNGWDSGAVGSNSFTEFNNGSLIDVAGSFSTLTFQLQPKTFPGNAQFQIQWKNAAGTVVGQTLDIEDYTTNMDLNVWQQVQIPITDFALGSTVQRLNFVYKVGTQRHYLDDIELQASGGSGPYTYEIGAPDSTTIYHVTMLVLLVSGASAGWNPNTFVNIPSLSNGVLLRQRRKSTGTVLWSFNSKDNVDLFGRYHPQDDIEFSDGTLLVGFMVKPGQAAIVVTDDAVLEYVVRDDLSGLTSARAFAHFGVEVIG